MIQIIRGKFIYNNTTYGFGSVLILSEDEEERLVRRNVAIKIEDEPNQEEVTTSEIGEMESFSQKVDKIRTKKELLQIASKMNIPIDESLDLKTMKSIILNFAHSFLDNEKCEKESV